MFGILRRHLSVASLASLGLLTICSQAAKATCLTNSCPYNGLGFSTASNNVQITNILGTGSLQTPYVIYQDVWGLDFSLAITGLNHAPQHSIFGRPGFAISIVSRNLTGEFWSFYDHELQETAGFASNDNDGLSFAQDILDGRPNSSAHYDNADEITDVRDFINFHGGNGVEPGEQVRFNYFITDTIPNAQFYVRQRPNFRTNTVPTNAAALPSTVPTTAKPAVPALSSTTANAPGAESTTTHSRPSPSAQPLSQPATSSNSQTTTPLKQASIPEPTMQVGLGLLGMYFLTRFVKQSRKCIDESACFSKQL